MWAIGQRELCELIREAHAEFAPLSLHDKAMDYYKTYLVVGGMPHAVREYADKRDFDFVSVVQRTLNDSYVADMAKYATPQETSRHMAAWASVPAQLAKENHKFQYKVIKSGALAENYICQALVSNGIRPYYWNSQGKAEVDFVFQNRQGEIIPLEAKSADNVRSKSLRTYRDMYKPAYVIRVSAKNFGHENGIKSVPPYAVFCLHIENI